MKLTLTNPPTFFVRVKGERGVREYRAVLDTGCTYCMIPKKDAVGLGYIAEYDAVERTEGEGGPVISGSFIIDVPFITLKEVSVGELTAKNLQTVLSDLPTPSGVDMILGTNFLKNFRVTFDFKNNALTIEED